MSKNILKLVCYSLALSLILPDMVDMSNAEGMLVKRKQNGNKSNKKSRSVKKQDSQHTGDSEDNDNDPRPNRNNNNDDDDNINPNDTDNDNNGNNSANQSSSFGEEFDNVRREFDKAVDSYIEKVKTKMGDKEVNEEELLFPNRLVTLMNKKKNKILKIKRIETGNKGAKIKFSLSKSNENFTPENIQTYKNDHFNALINHKIFIRDEDKERNLQVQIENLQSKAEGNEDINTVVKVADAFKPLLKIYRNFVSKGVEKPISTVQPNWEGLKSCVDDWIEETKNKGNNEILTLGQQFKGFRIIRFFLVLVATPCPGCKYSMIIFLNNLKQVVDNLNPDIRFTKGMLSPFVTAAKRLSDAKVIPYDFKGDLGGTYVAMHNIPVTALNRAVRGLSDYIRAQRIEIELREEMQRQGQNGETSHDESDDSQNMHNQLLLSFIDQNLGLMDMNQGQAELEAGNSSDDENTPDNPANVNLNNNNSDNDDDSADDNDRIVEDSENIQSDYKITQLELSLLIALLKMGHEDYRGLFDGLNGCYNKAVGARTIPAINLGQVTKRIRDIFENSFGNLSNAVVNDGICIALQYAIDNLPQRENRFFILNGEMSEEIAQERKAILMGHLRRFKEAVSGERAPEEKRERYEDTIKKQEVQKQELPKFMHRDIGKKFDQNAEKGNKKGIIYDVENVKDAVRIVMRRLGANAGEIKILLMNIKSGEFEKQTEWLENQLNGWIYKKKNLDSLENALHINGTQLGANYVSGNPARTIVNIIREGLENSEIFELLPNMTNENNLDRKDKSGDDVFNTVRTFVIADLLNEISEVLGKNKVKNMKIGFIRTALINAFGKGEKMEKTINEVIQTVRDVLDKKNIEQDIDGIINELKEKIIK